MNMTIDLSLDTLSTTEKIALMERLCADLSQCPHELPCPNWYGDMLVERMAGVREGRTAFVDWNEAKQRLRDRLA
jgi:Putative addiction module component